MISDIFSSVASTLAASPLTPLVGYGAMIWLGAEALGRIRTARRVVREADTFADYLSLAETARHAAIDTATVHLLPGGFNDIEVRRRGDIFLNETLVPLRHQLQGYEVLGPLFGLGFTMLAWALALPDAVEVLRSAPDQIMRTLGMGAATSCIGVVIAAMSFMAGKRLDIAHDRIQPRLEALAVTAATPPHQPVAA